MRYFLVEVCPSLSLFDGEVSYSRQFPANQADRHGIVATFRCPSDRWVLVGSGSATCNSVGDWVTPVQLQRVLVNMLNCFSSFGNEHNPFDKSHSIVDQTFTLK